MAVDPALVADACDALSVDSPEPLKEGGQKSVFRVTRGTEDLVLKVIEVSSSAPDAVRRAEREVELLRGIDSPHVAKVASALVELGSPPRGVAWLEEFLDGEDLGALVGAPWPWNDAGVMACEVATGLGALHEHHVTHRDLSANNVRRTAAGTYVVMDPGYARHELRSGLTIGGHPGTPGFASPEHLHAYSGSPTPFSDVFCVGVLLYLALTGDVPVPYRGDEADYLRRLQEGKREPVQVLRPDLTDEQVAVVDKCLHPQAARRYKNGAVLAAALEALL